MWQSQLEPSLQPAKQTSPLGLVKKIIKAVYSPPRGIRIAKPTGPDTSREAGGSPYQRSAVGCSSATGQIAFTVALQLQRTKPHHSHHKARTARDPKDAFMYSLYRAGRRSSFHPDVWPPLNGVNFLFLTCSPSAPEPWMKQRAAPHLLNIEVYIKKFCLPTDVRTNIRLTLSSLLLQ